MSRIHVQCSALELRSFESHVRQTQRSEEVHIDRVMKTIILTTGYAMPIMVGE